MSDTPSAFPHVEPRNPEFANSNPGMSLRDWFAGQALAGIAVDTLNNFDGDLDEQAETAAIWSYSMADAMLARRSVLS